MLKLIDVRGDTVWLALDAVKALCIPAAFGADHEKCRVLLERGVFLDINRAAAEDLLAQLAKETV
jgi:hypothetical protein